MIGGAGFAMMAWREAQRRTYNCDQHEWASKKWKWPFQRYESCGMPDLEYYRIIDYAGRKWNEMANFHNWCIKPYGWTVKL